MQLTFRVTKEKTDKVEIFKTFDTVYSLLCTTSVATQRIHCKPLSLTLSKSPSGRSFSLLDLKRSCYQRSHGKRKIKITDQCAKAALLRRMLSVERRSCVKDKNCGRHSVHSVPSRCVEYDKLPPWMTSLVSVFVQTRNSVIWLIWEGRKVGLCNCSCLSAGQDTLVRRGQSDVLNYCVKCWRDIWKLGQPIETLTTDSEDYTTSRMSISVVFCIKKSY